MALSLETGNKPLTGVGDVPSWLTDENAAALRGAPCVHGAEADKACWYCKPTPKPSSETNEKLKAELAARGSRMGEPGDDPLETGKGSE